MRGLIFYVKSGTLMENTRIKRDVHTSICFKLNAGSSHPVTRKTQPNQASSEMEATSLTSAASPPKCVKRLKNKNEKRKE